MIYHWHDFIGNLGVFLILLSYFNLQKGRWESSSKPYLYANLIGSIAILVSLYFNFNVSAFVIEIAWCAISLYGLCKQARVNPGSGSGTK